MATETPRKRCLYEVIGVSRDASAEEIRSAYRRLALQLHPDKQLAAGTAASSAAATAAFQELLHAYEVLSDPKERSWYDSHRSQILFSNPSPNTSRTTSSSFFDLDLYSYFSSSAFSGFSDSGKGFFKVYGDLFAKIYSQELFFAKELDLPSDVIPPAPLIGNLESPYTQVTAFYNYWLGFSTVMDFAWVDEYDTSAGPNRRARRAMEEENKKVRKKARREYIDSVRGLAAFVKKRDKRVVDMQLKKKNEEEKRRKEENERRKEEERKKLERAMMYTEQDWAKIDEEEMEDAMFDDLVEDERRRKKDEGVEELYCVACSKKFKSDKQWKNHEQSKKHKEKVAELRDSFLEEEDLEGEAEVDADEKGTHAGFDYKPLSEEEDSDAVEELCENFEEDVGLKEEDGKDGDVEGGDRILGSDDEESVLEAMASGHKNRNSNRNSGPAEFHESQSPSKDFNLGNDEDGPVESDKRRRHRRRATKKGDQSGADAGSESAERSETTLRDDGDSRNGRSKDIDRKEEASYPSGETTSMSKADRGMGKSQKLKKQQANKSALMMKEAVSESKNSSKGRKQKVSSKAPSNACGTCGENFDSRNKLFAHLGDTGHAMLKSR